MSERRNDVGQKVLLVVVGAVLSLFLKTTFDQAWTMASQAYEIAHVNKTDIARLQENYSELLRRMTTMDAKLDKALAKNE